MGDPREDAKKDAEVSDAQAAPDQRAEVTEKGPYDMEAFAKGPRIKTLDELLDFCEVDREKWAVSRHKLNKWEVTLKLGKHDVKTVPMFQVKADLVRRAPVAVKKVRATKVARVKVKKAKTEQVAAFIPDTQHGFVWSEKYDKLTPLHDNRAIDVTLQLMKKVQPDVIVLLGDHLDLAPWSDKYRTDPLFRQTTQPTIDTLYWHLKQLRIACPKAHIVYLTGNHEERINKALDARMEEARHLRAANSTERLMSLDSLLCLDSLDIETVGPYGHSWWLWPDEAHRPIHLNHGMSFTSSGSTAGKKAQKQVYSKVFGHIHRRELAVRTIHGPDGPYEVFSMTPGCLCRVDGAVPSVNPRMNWQQGVGLAYLDGDYIHPELYGIQGGRLCYGGTVLVGEDPSEQIAKDTGWTQMSP